MHRRERQENTIFALRNFSTFAEAERQPKDWNACLGNSGKFDMYVEGDYADGLTDLQRFDDEMN